MMDVNEIEILNAITEAVNAAVLEFGIEGIRALSMFPSAQLAYEEELLAA